MTSSLVFEPTSGHRGLATWTRKQQPAQRAADSAPKPGWSEQLGPGMAPARGTSGDRVEGTGSRKEAECEWGPRTNSTGVDESRGRGSLSPPLSFGLKMGEARRGSQPLQQRQHRRGSCWKGTFHPHPTSTGWEALWGAQPCGVSKPLGLPPHLKFEHRLGTLLCPKGVEPGEGGGGAAWGQGCPIQEKGWGAGLGGRKVGGVGHMDIRVGVVAFGAAGRRVPPTALGEGRACPAHILGSALKRRQGAWVRHSGGCS